MQHGSRAGEVGENKRPHGEECVLESETDGDRLDTKTSSRNLGKDGPSRGTYGLLAHQALSVYLEQGNKPIVTLYHQQ